jgi:DNA-binding NtrC family response regulator
MTPTEQTVPHRVLLVDDDDAVLAMMNATLTHKGFDVVAVASVTEALRHIETYYDRELRRAHYRPAHAEPR